MGTLWQISFESQNEKARDESMELLVDLHLKLSANYDSAAKRVIMEQFIDKSMAMLEETGKEDASAAVEQKALNVVSLLSSFLDRYEGKKPIKPEMRLPYSNVQPWTVTVICRKDGNQQ